MADLSGVPQNTVVTTIKAPNNAGTITAVVLAVVFGILLILAGVVIFGPKKAKAGAPTPAPAAATTMMTGAPLSFAISKAAALATTSPSPSPLQTPVSAYGFPSPVYAALAPSPYMPTTTYMPSAPAPAYNDNNAPAYAYAPAAGSDGSTGSDGSAGSSVPTEGAVSQTAQAQALRKANRARRASERAAANAAGAPSGASTSTSADAPAPVVAPAPSGSGKLGSAIATAGDKSLVHMANSKIANTGSMNDFVDDSAASMQLYAPDLKDTMDKSLSLSGVSAAFGLDPTQTQLRKQQAIAENMVLSGTVDPSINQVLDASAPFIATSSAIRRAIAAQSSVNNETIIQTPLRFMWQSPLYRPAIPMATMSPITSDLMTPGQAFYLQSIACANGDGPVVQESF